VYLRICKCVFVHFQPASPVAILEQHATDANSESSRSHAMLQVFIRHLVIICFIILIIICFIIVIILILDMQVFLQQKDKTAGLSGEVKVAKMSLIDLAGSEKGSITTGKMAARFASIVMLDHDHDLRLQVLRGIQHQQVTAGAGKLYQRPGRGRQDRGGPKDGDRPPQGEDRRAGGGGAHGAGRATDGQRRASGPSGGVRGRPAKPEEPQEHKDLIKLQDPWTAGLERHQLLVRRYTIEQVAATNLELRIRFKKQLHVRNMHLSISKKDQVRICGFAYL
jgi:hypothetical protein